MANKFNAFPTRKNPVDHIDPRFFDLHQLATELDEKEDLLARQTAELVAAAEKHALVVEVHNYRFPEKTNYEDQLD